MNALAAMLAISFLQFFEARNQIANFVVTPPSEGTGVRPELPDLVVSDKCPGCDGRGRLVLEEPDYGQFKGRIGSRKKVRRECPLCGGKGKTKAFMNPAMLALQVAEDRAAFAAEHQGRGEIAVGEAFVPSDKYDGLSRERRKLVEDAYGRPCKKCNWTGIEACRKCRGNGVVRCTGSDCRDGWLVVMPSTAHRATTPSVSACPTCGGIGLTACPECGGRRANPCSKCGGLGIKRKGSL